MERYSKMEPGEKLEKSIGSSSSGAMENGGESVQQKSTANKKESPVLKDARSKVESSNSTGGASHSPNLLAILLALQVIKADFLEVKNQLPASRETSGNGKIYWCAEFPGHILAIENGKLLVDGESLENLLAKLPAVEKKSTGGK